MQIEGDVGSQGPTSADFVPWEPRPCPLPPLAPETGTVRSVTYCLPEFSHFAHQHFIENMIPMQTVGELAFSFT